MRNLAALALFSCLASAPCSAFTGSNLLEACENVAEGFNRGVCFGYLLGFVKGLEYAGISTTAHFSGWKGFEATSSEAKGILAICMPDAVEGEQVRLVVLKFLQEHPERLHELAHFLLADALMDAFPCR